ncbi:LAQU0S11e02234g1_1 [Lachancea quebecensis]|uniref:LAQU0S11e02234g1_1 n=1 Tax=Lachancea quebecensis TaxID=1654605 RepID=A0A0P1KTY4_9SACH|nr:LAQU0S11e02234g1_1 [Lachancea quebecensis]
MVTNTLIITSNKKDVTQGETTDQIRNFLESQVLTRYSVTRADAMQLVVLPALQRLILVCPSAEIAQEAMAAKAQHPDLDSLQFRFSVVDTTLDSRKQYLKLPPKQSMFLVSPPTSPPPEFDYSRLEDVPNREKGLAPVSHHSQTPAAQPAEQALLSTGHHVLLETPRASITLDCCAKNTATGDEPVTDHVSINGVRTGMPPRSIFDDIED